MKTSKQSRQQRQKGVITPAWLGVLTVMMLLAVPLVSRWFDSTLTRRGQFGADAVVLFSLPVVVPPEYLPVGSDTTQNEVEAIAFLKAVAENNGATDTYFHPFDASSFETEPDGRTEKLNLLPKPQRMYAIIGHAEGVPAATIRSGFVFDDFSRNNLMVPMGCLPVAVEITSLHGSAATAFAVDFATADGTVFGDDPRDEIGFLAGDPGTAPPARRVGETIVAAPDTGPSVVDDLDDLIGVIVIFPVTMSGRILAFCRARIDSVVPPPPPVGGGDPGLQSGIVNFTLEPSAVSPAAVRGDGYPDDIAVPAEVEFGQVLRARNAN